VPLELHRVAQEAAALYESRARRRGVSFVIGELPQAHGDNDLVRRVLSNLIGNAVKATSRGTVTIGARRVVDDGSHTMVEIAVEDTGPGLTPEAVECLFQKYGPARLGHSAEAASTPIDRGLGLYFCRLAIEAHGGRIWAESHPGQGSRFLFTLPAEASPPADLPERGSVALATVSIG
jgi:signal transduction histidine kinase